MHNARFRKYLAMFLSLTLIIALFPVGVQEVKAARAADDEVIFGAGTTIGNLSYDATNAFINFNNDMTVGFRQTKKDSNSTIDWGSGDVYTGKGDNGTEVKFRINVADNPTLKDFAMSDHAEMLVGWNHLVYYEGSFLGIPTWTRISSVNVIVDGRNVLSGHSGGDNTAGKHTKVVIKSDSVIEISVYGEGDDDGDLTGVRGFYIKFQDKERPKLTNYTFTGNGNERLNPNSGQTELYVKQQENITMTYNFSEPVKPSLLNNAFYEHFLRHPLFVNPDGTGYPAAGQQMYFTNQTYTKDNIKSLHKDIEFKYTGVRFHNSGNNPLEPKITGSVSGVAPMDMTLEQKITEAKMTDGAGNVADTDFPFNPGSNSNNYLRNKSVNPFDYKNGGYRVIVDGVAPRYTKTGNGITPEIVTGVTVNKNDYMEFTIKFTEEATIRRGYTVNDTFIHFNNGMKARYLSGNNTDTWTFGMDIPDGKEVETPLLKVVALTNEGRLAGGSYPDIDIISDYAGNLLIEPANLKDKFTDRYALNNTSDTTLVNSTIDWAQLAIDNTKPDIAFRFEAGGATNQLYMQNGKVTIDANDPTIKIPPLDPIVEIRGEERPSQGIYRPSNMTGDASPAVGLVYYYWSQDPSDPFEGKEGDNFAAIKRYSLSAKQPSDELYPNDNLGHVQLQVANNKTNMIAPPAKARTAEASGEWYLHSWTADMTWDSARELMQYEKKKEYVKTHEEQYEAWKKELTSGSEADRIFYADNKALAAVGQYGDIEVWPLDDFVQEDSNWTYNKTVFLLDNQAPAISFSDLSGDGTMDVRVTTSISDAHSGVATNNQNSETAAYQWVKAGNAPTEIEWKNVSLTGGKFTVTTLNEVFEDGEYELYVKTSDKAGNASLKKAEKLAVVNSAATVVGGFDPESNENYVQSHDVLFWLSGIDPDYVGYAYSTSQARPASVMGYSQLNALAQPLLLSDSPLADGSLPAESDGLEAPKTEGEVTVSSAGEDSGISNSGNEAGNNEEPDNNPEAGSDNAGIENGDEPLLNAALALPARYDYSIPADTSKNGTQYIHVMVKQGDRYYYFTKAYYFDNVAPVVTFSKNGVAYPLEQQDTTVTIEETYSKTGVVKQYQWVQEGSVVPTADGSGWSDLPANGKAVLDNSSLTAGTTADFKLYVKAIDGAGNTTLAATTGIFKVSKPGGKDTAPAKALAKLLYVFGDATEGYQAVASLDIDTQDKRGYEYSISPDDGASWQKWRPYTNFVSVKVDSGVASQVKMKVKFKTPAGNIGEPIVFSADLVSAVEPVYATATLSTLRPVNADKGVEIAVSPPLGIKVSPSASNLDKLVRKGNTFTVHKNGYYAFDLTDLNDAQRKDTLYVVVNNFDDIAPEGTVEYMMTAPTSGNVTVQLASTSEPVTVISGSTSYTFTENGSYTFKFMDEAGNIGEAIATVNNIDKSAPKVKIARSYNYGTGGTKSFNTINDVNGNVLLASGVLLEVQLDEPAGSLKNKLFGVDKGISLIASRNGDYSFVVADNFGNTTKIEAVVDNIETLSPEPKEIVYEFVDNDEKPLPANKIVTINGQEYAKGKMKVTLKGEATAPNAIFAGVQPIKENGEYTNQISEENGTYAYSRVYSAEGTTTIGLSDLLGNVAKVQVQVKGIDNKAPELVLKSASTAISQNKKDFDFRKDLGGFTVSDNVSSNENIKVEISGLDLTKTGRNRVKYTATDQVGNVTEVYQDVVVVSDAGMLIFANNTLISAKSGETAIFDTNKLTFDVSRYNNMTVGGQDLINEWGTYDLLYYSGLFREGQMKYIATKLTYKELMNGKYEVTFPKAGWYTIVVRNQEREREFATFFISKTE